MGHPDRTMWTGEQNVLKKEEYFCPRKVQKGQRADKTTTDPCPPCLFLYTLEATLVTTVIALGFPLPRFYGFEE